MAKKAKASKKSSKGAASLPATPDNLYRVSKIYKAPKTIDYKRLPSDFARADLEFIGVDHSGASYEGRVYVNNPNADGNTQATATNGYAGSFYIFGHGGCFGDLGHCDVHPRTDPFDPRPSHPLEPIKKVVVATEAIKTAAAAGKGVHVTVVPIVMSYSQNTEISDVCKFDHINLVTYA